MDNLIVNEQDNRFEYKVDDAVAFIDYKRADDVYTLKHVEVPAELSGKGTGTKLVTIVLEYLQENNLKLIPLCPFVTSYLQRNPEWKSLIANGDPI